MSDPAVAQSRPVTRPILIGLALLGIVAVALGTRLPHLDSQSLFLDEFWYLELATGHGSLHLRLPSETLLSGIPRTTSLANAAPWTAVLTNMDHVTHPPLYPLLLRFWIEAFGASDLAGRSLSMLLSTAAILLLFDAVRIHDGSVAVALWAALIMAVAGAQVELSQEIRPYTLLLLLGVGAINATARIERFGPANRRLIGLGLWALAMLLTHYFAMAAVGGLGIYALVRLRGRSRIRVIATLIAASLLFALLWGRSMLAQSGSLADGDGWLRVQEPHHLLQTLKRIASLPMLMLLNAQRATSPIIYASSVVLILPLLLLRRRPQLLLWLVWFWATVGAMAAMELLRSTRHLEFVRYTLLAAPALYVILVEVVPPPPPRSFGWLRHAVPAVVVPCCLAWLPGAYYPWKPDYRELAQLLDRARADDAPVIFCTSARSTTGGAEIYIGASHYSSSYPWPFVIVEGRPSKELLQKLRTYPTVLVIAAPSGLMASDLFPEATVDERKLVPYLATLERVRTARQSTRP